MQKVWIRLSSVRQVQKFVATLTPLKGDFEFISGRYILDARSLMAVLGLDLSKPLCLQIYEDSPENMAAIKPYITDTEDALSE